MNYQENRPDDTRFARRDFRIATACHAATLRKLNDLGRVFHPDQMPALEQVGRSILRMAKEHGE